MQKQKNKQRGITLIALVVTIIVLIVLAGVSIAMIIGDNGILTRATEASKQSETASVKEQAQLDIANWISDRLENGEDTTLDDITVKNIIKTANANNANKYYKELQNDKIITQSGYEILYSELYSNSNVETLPSTEETQPYLPNNNFHQLVGTTLDTGLVITDEKDYYVWIEAVSYTHLTLPTT